MLGEWQVSFRDGRVSARPVTVITIACLNLNVICCCVVCCLLVLRAV